MCDVTDRPDGRYSTVTRRDWSRATDRELAAATHAGDDAAFEILYRRCERILYGIFTSRMPVDSLADADELVVDTMAEAWKSLRNTVPRNFRSWLWKIAWRNWAAYLSTMKKTTLIADYERFEKRDLTVEADYRLAEMRAGRTWFVTLLEDSINSMPAKYRPVLLANLRSGAAGQDLATQLGITTQQANHWRHEALRRLYDAAAVTVLARGEQQAKACRRFRRLLAENGWRGGPLGEPLLRTLGKHVDQCARCNTVKRRLKKTLQLTPVFILVMVPTGLFALVQERRDGRDRRGARPQPVAAVSLEDEEKNQPNTYKAAGAGGGGVVTFILAAIVVRALNDNAEPSTGSRTGTTCRPMRARVAWSRHRRSHRHSSRSR